MTPTELLATSAAHALGWTLLHFLWQGAVVMLVLAVLLWLTRAANPSARYALSCAGLALMVLAPGVTYAVLASQSEATPDPSFGLAVSTSQPSQTGETGAAGVVGTHQTSSEFSRAAAVQHKLEPFLSLVVAFWSLGVLVLSARLLGGLWLLRKIKTRFGHPIPDALVSSCHDLAGRLGITRVVQLRASFAVRIPLVIGWLRPVILLPTSAISGLSTRQLEMILAHELAHIRRNDYLINLVQHLAETLLFYHPAVWWVSAKIRDEREHCCDDVAVSLCGGDRRGYAKALTKLDDMRLQRLAPAATGGSLLKRIRRLAGKTLPQTPNPTQWTAGLVLILGPLLGFSFVSASQRQPALLGTYTTTPFGVAELRKQGFTTSAACRNSGRWTLVLTENGFFSGNQLEDARCTHQNPYVTGSWQLSGRSVTFRDAKDSGCGVEEYSYRYKFADGALVFTPVDDSCRERVYLFSAHPWKRPL